MRLFFLPVTLAAFLIAAPGRAQEETPAPAAPAAEPAPAAKPAPAAEPELSVTSHSITLDGREIAYTAAAGFMPIRDESGELLANIFHVAYTLDGVEDPADRPVTFVFNGGPGSASVWLHMGAAGPYRVHMSDEGEALPPPGKLIVNEGTWLGATDLVFIDPVGTGYSRPAKGHKQSEFSGIENDARSVAEFIRLWTTQNARWASPKFLAGESYGTTRAAALARRLQSANSMYLNGIFLISSILEFQTAQFDPGNDLPYVLFLPTFTATAWEHGRLPADLQNGPLTDALDESRTFAIEEYLPALAKGDALDAGARATIVRRLARLTGLSAGFIDRANLRVEIGRFAKELLRDQRRTVGRLDTRFTGMDRDAVGERFEYDPSLAAITGPYAASINDYLRRQLGFESDLPYEMLTGRVRPWPWGDESDQGYVNVAEDLRRAMTQNPYLKVHVASGYYDLATPFFATEYTFGRLGLEPALRSNISMSHYKSGHMVYIRKQSLLKLRAQVERFIADATAPREK